MREINYTTAEDLLTDEGFLHWYHQTDPEELELWRQWINADPKNKELADEAVQLLSVMHQSEKTPEAPDQLIVDALNRMSQASKKKEVEHASGD